MRGFQKVLSVVLLSGLFFSNSAHAGPAELSHFAVCFSPKGQCDQRLVSLVASAHSTIDIAIYSLTLPVLVDALLKLNQGGIKIRIVADRKEAASSTSLVKAVINAGIPLKFGNVQGIMHNKFTIVDGKLLETGSFNYSNAATHLNAENQLYLDNPTVVHQYQAQFEELWSNGIPVSQND